MYQFLSTAASSVVRGRLTMNTFLLPLLVALQVPQAEANVMSALLLVSVRLRTDADTGNPLKRRYWKVAYTGCTDQMPTRRRPQIPGRADHGNPTT